SDVFILLAPIFSVQFTVADPMCNLQMSNQTKEAVFLPLQFNDQYLSILSIHLISKYSDWLFNFNP
ncbi:hypothetical protein OB236_15165, partial [Paenibacillus sp. WQ 127069]